MYSIQDWPSEYETDEVQPGEGSKSTFIGKVRTPGYQISMSLPTVMVLVVESLDQVAFWGTFTVLPSYLTHLGFSEHDASTIQIFFLCWSYISALVTGLLSDLFLGRFKMIYLALWIYFIGSLLMAVSSISSFGRPFAIVGVFIGIISVGFSRGTFEATGAVFMMDQLIGPDPDEDAIAGFFRTHLWTINSGKFCGAAVVSLLLMFGEHYWVAFFLAFASATSAGVLFFFFRRNFVQTAPSRVNMLLQYGIIIHDAIRNKIYTSNIAEFGGMTWSIQPRTWLDWAKADHGTDEVDGLFSVLIMLLAFSPFAFFWALQILTTEMWVSQAASTSRALGQFVLTPEQTAVIRPLMGLVFMPIMNYTFFPLLRKSRRMVRPVTRMIIGLLWAIIATLTALVVQIEIDAHNSQAVSFLWQLPQYWFLCMSDIFFYSTGLEMIYTETPNGVKSMMVAFYTLTYAIGHICIIIVSKTLPMESRQIPINVYGIMASLMFLFMGFFGLVMRNFRYHHDYLQPVTDTDGRKNDDDVSLIELDEDDETIESFS
eukprot:TRINITY_DN6185_c0_g1_i1.p1 TRINITY_DN6185_c0_g1~~TRINITY_DN6185_c0_g1_i1.p1  ORF type:complete len:542 (+),score=52.31 TRINITY_DN6185_c0_g1_i1:48-1673(+)